MDPSMLMAFLIKDEVDWEDWRRRMSEVETFPPFCSAIHNRV
jgi:hypothetical protein